MRTSIVSVVWGPWHVEQLVTVNLPTFLSHGNLPTYAKANPVTFELHTTRQDAARILACEAYERIAELVTVRLLELEESRISDPIATHHRIWREATERARRARALIFFLPPDVVWADGSLAALDRRIREGKTAIYNMYLRVISESFVPDLLASCVSRNGSLAVESTRLVDLALRHLHPLTFCYAPQGGRIPSHSEFLVWSAAGRGVLVTLLARELLVFDPRQVRLNENALIEEGADPERVCVLTDSREFCAMSLAPMWQDASWYRRSQPYDPVRIASWWLRYDSPLNDYLASHPIRFWGSRCTSEDWASVATEQERTVTEIRALREILRVHEVLKALGFSRAGELFQTLLSDPEVAAGWDPDLGGTLLVPTDSAFDAYRGAGEAGESGDLRHPLRVLQLLQRHRLVESLEFWPPWDVREGASIRRQRTSVRNALGDPIEIGRDRHAPTVAGVPLAGYGLRVGKTRIYPIGGVLRRPADAEMGPH